VTKIHKDGWYLCRYGKEVVIYHGHSSAYWMTIGFVKIVKGVCDHAPPKSVVLAWDLANLHIKLSG
jgi:hypothetical protein